MIRRALRLGPSLAIYGLGVGGLYVADLLISRVPDHHVVAEWATLKAFTMIGGTIALLGLDQAVVRDPGAMRHILDAAKYSIPITALCATFGALMFGGVSPAWIVGLTISGFAASTMLAAYGRAHFQFNQSLIAANGWRILFAGAAISPFFVRNPDFVLVAALVVNVVVSWLLLVAIPPKSTEASREITDTRSAWTVGFPYFISAASLSLAAYGEAIVAGALGSSAAVTEFFRLSLLYLAPGVALNTFVATFLGPSFRRDRATALKLIRRRVLQFGVAGLGLAGLLLVIGALLQPLIFPDLASRPAAAAVLALTAGIRFSYIVLGAIMGVLAPLSALRASSFIYLLSALAMPVVAFALHSIGLDVVQSVAIANLANWSVRTLVAAYTCLRLPTEEPAP